MINSLRALIIIFVIIGLGADAQSISAGRFHSLFLCTTGASMAAGQNYNGQLGNGTTRDTSLPFLVPLSDVIAVSGGDATSFFIKSDSTVWSCGYSGNGRLGIGPATDIYNPFKITSLSGIVAVSACGHSLFLKDDSTVWACGDNLWGQLGNGGISDEDTPVKDASLSGIISASASMGGSGSLFLKSDSTVWACGSNYSGQFGNGSFDFNKHSVPAKISSLSGIVAIAAGASHSLFLKSDGTVWGCGANSDGQLGTGAAGANELTAVRVKDLTGIIAIAAGEDHSLFLKNDGTVWACGRNQYGELGDGTNNNQRATAYQIPLLSGIIKIVAGDFHSIFLKNDGTVWACGDNDSGQLGDGSTTERDNVVQVTGLCNMLGVEENSKAKAISVYPNPSATGFTISLGKPIHNAAIKIFNSLGDEVYHDFISNIPTGNTDIQLRVTAGIYFLEVTNGIDNWTEKILID